MPASASGPPVTYAPPSAANVTMTGSSSDGQHITQGGGGLLGHLDALSDGQQQAPPPWSTAAWPDGGKAALDATNPKGSKGQGKDAAGYLKNVMQTGYRPNPKGKGRSSVAVTPTGQPTQRWMTKAKPDMDHVQWECPRCHTCNYLVNTKCRARKGTDTCAQPRPEPTGPGTQYWVPKGTLPPRAIAMFVEVQANPCTLR